MARAGALRALLVLGVPGAACPSCGGGADRTDPRAGLERPLVEVHRSGAAGFAATITLVLTSWTAEQATGSFIVQLDTDEYLHGLFDVPIHPD